MKYIVQLSRIFTGILFIISGFIKLNDPLGFSYKLQDYFAADVLNLEFLIPYALGISVIVVVFEVVIRCVFIIRLQTKIYGLEFTLNDCVFYISNGSFHSSRPEYLSIKLKIVVVLEML